MRLGKVVHVLALAENGTLVAERALHLQGGMVVHEGYIGGQDVKQESSVVESSGSSDLVDVQAGSRFAGG